MVTTAEVTERWRELRAHWDRGKQRPGMFAGLYPVMADMIDAAYAVPVLRQLPAGTSHFELHFWACPVHWRADRIPYVEPCMNIPGGSAGPGYYVRMGRSNVIGEADDADSAIALLLEHLPASVGPAGACPVGAVVNPIEGLLAEWDRRGEREARAALSPAWRANSGTTNGWYDVLRALRALPQIVSLPDNELAVIASVAARIDEVIRRRR